MDSPCPFRAVLRREYAGGTQASQAVLARVPGCRLGARRAPSQGRVVGTVGTAVCTRDARCPAPGTHRSTREGLSVRPRATGPRGAVAGRSGPGSAADAISGMPPAAVGPDLAFA